jgi:undecaprenyl diphosphate synthase
VSASYVAIITDGNGRWAKQRGLSVAAGHEAGADTVKARLRDAADLGIRELTVYSFSTENWSRPQDEVDALMEIFAETIERELPDLAEQGVRVRFIGRRDRAPEGLRRRMDAMEDRTGLNTRINLWVAFDYGGRSELVEAARRIVESGVEAADIDENVFAANLYAPELPDPDLLIRTSGELRISNFLLWQVAYSELVFVDKLWPDFEARDLRGALAEYAQRRRRFGGR